MYNRYMNPDGFNEVKKPAGEAQCVFEDVGGASENSRPTEKPKAQSKGLFGGSIKLPEFDADTILMLVLVYFLISDELSPSSGEDGDGEKSKHNISDTLLIIGALLLLGF